MPSQLLQPSFAAGELDPLLYSRVDLAKYHTGCRTLLNWFVHAQGGASNCPGTAFVGELQNSAKTGRLIPFQFSTLQTYVLEFGDLSLRFITNGGYILESTTAISAITKANPGVVTDNGHGYTTGDRVYLASIGGMTQLNGRYVTVTVTGANTYSIGIDTTGFTTYTSGGTAARVYTVTTPYAYGDLASLKYEQSADTMTLMHQSYPAKKLTRTTNTAWTLANITFAPSQAAPTVTAGSGYQITAINDTTGEESLGSATTGTLSWAPLTGCTSYNVYKASNNVYGFIGIANAPSGGGSVTFTDGGITADTQNTPPQQRQPFGLNTITGATITAAGTGYSSPTATIVDPGGGTGATMTLTVSGGAITVAAVTAAGRNYSNAAYVSIAGGAGTGATLSFTYTESVSTPGWYYISGVTVTAGGSGYHSGAYVQIIRSTDGFVSPQVVTLTVAAGVVTGASVVLSGDAYAYYDQVTYFVQSASIVDSTGSGGAVSLTLTANASTNPGCSTYYDGRQWFAGTANQPQTLWGSVSGAFNNMSVSVPTRDSDAITRTLASRQVDAIKHMVPLTQLILLTSGAEWKVSAGSSDVITPAQFTAKPQSYNGCSDIRPLVLNDILLYTTASKKKVRGLQYQWAADTWTGPDYSLLSQHLFDTYGLTAWAYARDPFSIVWGVRADGTALAFTFQAEQQVYAWARRTMTNGSIEDVCVVQEGTESAVYFIVNRTIGGATKRYVERMASRTFATISDAWFLDCALEYSGASSANMTGLWHLAGEAVYALADGKVQGPFTVSASGGVTLTTAATKAIIGKIIPDADLETLDVEQPDQSGSLQGRKKKINHVTVSLKNSANVGLKAGPSGGQGTPLLYAFKSKDIANPLASAPSTDPALTTDLMTQIAAPSWDWHGRTLIRVSNSPLPYTVTGVMYDVTAG